MKVRLQYGITRAALFGVTAIGLSILHLVPASAQTKLIHNNFTPPTHPFTKVNRGWAADAEKASNGKLKFRFPAKTLAPPPRQWSMVTSGVADVTSIANIFETRRLTLPELATLPFSTVSAEKSSIALWKTYKKYFESSNEYKGVKLLGFFVHTGGDLNMRDIKINKASDLKNLKIRVSRGMASKEMKAMGAVLVVTPGVKTFEVVSKGIVDGAILPSGDIYKMKMIPYIKTIYTIPGKFYNTPFSTIMNQKKWDGLPADVKQAITSASGLNIARHGKHWDDALAEAQPHFKKAGIKVQQISDEVVSAMKKKFASFDADWIADAAKKGVDGAAALRYYREQSKM